MLVPALALLALSVLGLVALLRRRRRLAERHALLARRVEPLPAGVKHLAASVSQLSDHGFHLAAATRALHKRRLGALLGLR